MRYIAILGRQPKLGLAELERTFGGENTTPFSDSSAVVDGPSFDVQTLGGTIKAGRVIADLPASDWKSIRNWLSNHYETAWSDLDRKQTLGISAYGLGASPRELQTFGINLKKSLKAADVSLRVLPNNDLALSSATSHHNKLGLSDNKTELLIVTNNRGRTVIAESVGAQNITALAMRDQGRPKRDAFVGMLPPKLALMMVNLASPPDNARVLDPFCGTGVILQEALLRGFEAYGSDLSEKMVEYTRTNLEWLSATHHTTGSFTVEMGDAITASWQPPIDAVVAETYLGQPFSAPPAPNKLQQVKRNCDQIISRFLENIAPQLNTGTPLCLAVPAWRDERGRFTHLPLIGKLNQLGYERIELTHVRHEELVYFREDQVVARQLLVLVRN